MDQGGTGYSGSWRQGCLHPIPDPQSWYHLPCVDSIDPHALGASAQAEFGDARLLFEQVPVGVFVYDRQLMIRDCNEELCQILQAPRKRLLGLDLTRLRDQRLTPAFREALEGRRGRYEGPYRSTIAGLEIYVEIRTAPFQDAAGRTGGGLAMVRDVTALVRSRMVPRALWELSEASHRAHSVSALEVALAQTITGFAPGLVVSIDEPSCMSPAARDPAIGALLELVRRSGRAVFRGEEELRQLGAGEPGLRRWSGIPLFDAGQVSGAAGVGWRGESGLFDERTTLDLLAGQVALLVERKRDEIRLATLARQDELTRMPNRRWLREQAQEVLATGRPALFLFADLDRFKRVNDTLGHDAGDELLCQVAAVLAEVAHGIGGLCARLGGDEFASLIPDVAEDRAAEVIGAFRDSLDRPFVVRGHRVRVSASIGVTLAPQHGRSLEELLRGADIALYEAKDAGSSWSIFDPGEAGVGERRLELEARLREAIEHDSLRMVFQPLRSLADRRLLGAEVLVRWPLGGRWLSAGEFVPLAEESDLIQRLDLWVLRQALGCLEAAPDWPGTLAVNLSARTLHDTGVVAHLRELLGAAPQLASRLIVEVTETAAVRRPTSLRRALEELRGLGVRVAIDDFGSGFASLTSLRAMPCDQLKIDRSLVAEIGVSDGAEPILTAALELGRGLGLEVVAEGIETEQQLEWLARAGCRFGQGWLLGKPLSWTELLSVDPGREQIPR